MTVRWKNPEGVVVQDESAELLQRGYITSVLEFGDRQPEGEWTVEALLDAEVVDVSTTQVVP